MPSSWRTWNRSWICITDPTIRIVPSCAWTSSRCSWSRKPAHRWRPRRTVPGVSTTSTNGPARPRSSCSASRWRVGGRRRPGPGVRRARQLSKRGAATWKETRTPDPESRYAAVRTDDGELHTGNWPSHRSVFTPEGLKISRAVVYLNREKTVAALNGLDDITDDVLVDALFDEVESYQFDNGLLEFLHGLTGQRPGIATHPRVVRPREAGGTRRPQRSSGHPESRRTPGTAGRHDCWRSGENALYDQLVIHVTFQRPLTIVDPVVRRAPQPRHRAQHPAAIEHLDRRRMLARLDRVPDQPRRHRYRSDRRRGSCSICTPGTETSCTPGPVPPATVPGTPVPRPAALAVETDHDFPSQSAREGPHSIKDHLRGWQHLQHAPSIARAGHDRRARGHAHPGSARRRAPLGAALIDEAQAARIAGAVVFVVPTLSLSAAMGGDVMAQELREDASDAPRIVDAARDPGQPFSAGGDAETSDVWSRAPALPIQAPGPGISRHGELRLMLRAGLSRAAAFAAATSTPAGIFGIDDRWRIDESRSADLVLVDDYLAGRCFSGREGDSPPGNAIAAALPKHPTQVEHMRHRPRHRRSRLTACFSPVSSGTRPRAAASGHSRTGQHATGQIVAYAYCPSGQFQRCRPVGGDHQPPSATPSAWRTETPDEDINREPARNATAPRMTGPEP